MRIRQHRILSNPWFPIGVIILVNLIIGALVVRDYGESHDEQRRYRYAERSLAAYTNGGRVNQDEKGPFYVMLARLGSDAIRLVWRGLRPIEAWHFMHYLSFQMGVLFLYWICRKMMSQEAAVGAVLLFDTQPLLWGHAWINPKDIPFMAFFLGSIALGMHMADSMAGEVSKPVHHFPDRSRRLAATIALDWKEASRRKRLLLLGLLALSVALLLLLLLGEGAIQVWIAALVTQAAAAGDASFLGRFFSSLAENSASIPLALYIQKSLSLYQRLVGLYALLMPVFCLFCAALLLPQARSQLWHESLLPALEALLHGLMDRRVLLAGLFLGFASAIRTLGPASGFLIGAYLLAKTGRRGLPTLLAYFAIGMLVTIAAWPALWRAPIQGYTSALGEATDFPWAGKVLFAGVDYPVGELPRSYLTMLLSLQFTEPALALFLAGFVLAALDILRKAADRLKLALVALWFFAPLAVVLVFMPTMYDNFRQFLFMVPPLFIFAGLGLQWVITGIKPFPVRLLILAALLLSGLYWDVRLHPYQYVYYNQLVGGVGGAFRSYEMDYWATSYREATEYLNAVASPGARVVVWGPDHLVERYARDDLVISDYRKEGDEPQDFAVISTRHDKDMSLYPDALTLFQTGRDGAVFTVVKRLRPQNGP